MTVSSDSEGSAGPTRPDGQADSGDLVMPTEAAVMGTVMRKLSSMYPYMEGHWQRVAFEAVTIGQELDVSRDAVGYLRTCAFLMDIGMIDESIHCLIAPDVENGTDFMQDPDIRRTVETHPLIGARKLEELGFSRPVILGVKHHHEWFNGWGYPDGLSGVAIPLLARVLAVADSFVAITRDIPYRAACSEAEALEEIMGYEGIQFDPWVVPALERVVTRKAAACESLIDKCLEE
jgi:HD-GYP domain-containing protein (c-di-GMP phosphodiesterase class II)